jgi:hypothetical protein
LRIRIPQQLDDCIEDFGASSRAPQGAYYLCGHPANVAIGMPQQLDDCIEDFGASGRAPQGD